MIPTRLPLIIHPSITLDDATTQNTHDMIILVTIRNHKCPLCISRSQEDHILFLGDRMTAILKIIKSILFAVRQLQIDPDIDASVKASIAEKHASSETPAETPSKLE